MKRQAFQPGEIRDEQDNIIRPGAYGKKTALATSDNMGILDYIINNFDALYDAMNGGRVYVKSAADLPKTGDVAAVYIAEDTGKWYYWDTNASKYITIDNARTIANEGITARDAAKAWAESGSSPDGATDSDSSTGKTQSSKSWALYSKDRATAAASSASASASSASAAKSSQTAAATSETNAKTALVSCQNIQTQVNNGLQSLTSAVKYRGSVASFSALPASGQSVGDMYNIKAAGGTDANGTAIRAGDNVVWNGSGWDDQAGTVDLSNYYTKSEVNGAVVSATVSDATLTLIHKDASKSTVTVNNVAHASKASQDDKGQTIDIAALKTLITTTVNSAVLQCKKDLYPVGSVYVSITDSRNPADILGFGTWEALPAGYGLVAQGTATAEDGSKLTFTAGQKSGEFKHQITVGEMPKISGTFYMADNVAKNEANANAFLGAEGCFSLGTSTHNAVKLNSGTHTIEIATSTDRIWFGFGADGYHNNVAPVLPVYAWRRTA